MASIKFFRVLKIWQAQDAVFLKIYGKNWLRRRDYFTYIGYLEKRLLKFITKNRENVDPLNILFLRIIEFSD